MTKETYIHAQLQLVEFDDVDIIATSAEIDPMLPSLGPNDTEIL